MNRQTDSKKITREQVRHVADLARLDMDEDSISLYAEQIGRILTHIDQLGRVDTENIAPTSHAIALTNAFRPDEVHEHLKTQTALSNAPDKDDHNFIVPKVVG